MESLKRVSIVEAKGYKPIRSIKKAPNVHTYVCIKGTDTAPQFLVKEFRFQHPLSPKHLHQINSELAILAAATHPNIVGVVEYFNTQTEFYLVTEYAEGGSLASWMASKKEDRFEFSEIEVLVVMVQICMALTFLHTKGLIYGNTKPSNVLLFCQRKMIKVSDVMLPSLYQGSSATPVMSAMNEMVYPPPELARDSVMTEKSDVWLLGLLLVEMATLQRAFQGRTFKEVFVAIQKGQYTPLPVTYSDELKSAVESMMKPDPSLRVTLGELLAMPCARVGMRSICATYDNHKSEDKPRRARLSPVRRTTTGDELKFARSPGSRLVPAQAFVSTEEEEKKLRQKHQHLAALPRQQEQHAKELFQVPQHSTSPTRAGPVKALPSRNLEVAHGTTFPMRGEKSPRLKGVPTAHNDLRWSADNLPKKSPLSARDLGQPLGQVAAKGPPGRRNSAALSAQYLNPAPVHGVLKRRHSTETTTGNETVPDIPGPALQPTGPPDGYDSLVVSMRSYLSTPSPEPPRPSLSHHHAVAHGHTRATPVGRSPTPPKDLRPRKERHVEFKRENDVFNYSVRNCSMKEFKMNGVPVTLPDVSPNDPLNVRLESLRIYLEKHLGMSQFRQLHKIISEAGLDESDAEIMRRALAIAGEDRRGFVELVSQLVFCEAIFDSQ